MGESLLMLGLRLWQLMDVQGSCKRVMLIRVSNSDNNPHHCCYPKPRLLVSCHPGIVYLVHWDKLLPHQIPSLLTPTTQRKEKYILQKIVHFIIIEGILFTSNFAKTKTWSYGWQWKIQEKVFSKVRSTVLQLICQRTHGNWLQETQGMGWKKKRLFISRSC